jgi:tripartite-type tricarboxylate transporter receptor subunit TctC
MAFSRLGLAAIFAGLTGFLIPGSAAAQFPAQSVKLIVPFSAGGTTDLTARIIAVKMGENLGQQIVVENIEGAGGTIGAEAVARAKPDGYTLILHTASTSAINPSLYKNLKYDMEKDFTPVSLITTTANILVVRKDFPAKNLQEFVAYAKSHPGELNYGSSGNGTILHLSMALFAKSAGIEMVHIPYRGAGPAMNDLIPGVIDAMFDNLPTGLPQVRGGNVRALGLSTQKRNPAIPETPTIAEQGYPDYETFTWTSLYTPGGTPPEIMARLHQAALAAANDPDTIKRLQDLGCEVIGSTPEELAAFGARQRAYWAPIVAESGARIE